MCNGQLYHYEYEYVNKWRDVDAFGSFVAKQHYCGLIPVYQILLVIKEHVLRKSVNESEEKNVYKRWYNNNHLFVIFLTIPL
jgi:hypothetical protein